MFHHEIVHNVAYRHVWRIRVRLVMVFSKIGGFISNLLCFELSTSPAVLCIIERQTIVIVIIKLEL